MTKPKKDTGKKIIRVLAGEEQSPPPFWLMRQAGRYLPEYREIRKKARNFLDFCYSPELAVEATLQPLRRYDMDAAILFSDILVIPDALGQKVEFREGEGPVLEPVRSVADLRNLSGDGIHRHLTPVYETISGIREGLPEGTALIGFAGAPWTVSVYAVEGRGGTEHLNVRGWALNAPDQFGGLIDLLVDTTVEYLIRQVESGVEMVQLFDSWAGILCETEFRRWVIEPTRKVISKFKESCPQVPVMGFPRGAGAMYGEYVRETGVDSVGLDSSVPLDWAAETLGRHCVLQGNLDNLVLVAGGAVLEKETRRILREMKGRPFIFNLGHGVLPNTPPDNVAELARLIREGSNP